jgi:MscS family membrane protein
MLQSLVSWIFICLALMAGDCQAQALTGALGGQSKPAPSAASAVDHLGRTSPRDAMYKFLGACHDSKYNLAAQYLDLKKINNAERNARGQELARQLCTLLDRNPRFQLSKLSDSSEGDKSDAMAPNIDQLATFDWNGELKALDLERVTLPSTGAIWLVSADSVSEIPALSEAFGESAFEKYLPAVLVNTRLLGTPIWVWLALTLIAAILSAISRLLSRILLTVLKPLTARYAKAFHAHRLEALSEPLRLLVSVVVFRACLGFISPTAIPRDLLLKLLTLLFMLGAASLLMRLVDIASDTILSRMDHTQRALSYSVFPLFVRFVKILIFCFAALVVLQQWGYNTSTILAGVGVGGVAIALAAQKTIENLFGGVSLISDRPVLVGDFCQFGGQVGTVEDIGLRSTRIRTLDRTLVTVPNSQFSTMTLENYSKRDRMWFHPTIRLRRDTSPDRVRKMMAAITDILQKHEMVDVSGVPLRFTKITEQSLDLDIFAYVLTPESNKFLQVQTELLLQILEASYSLGVGLAVPFSEGYNVNIDTEQELLNPYLAFQDKTNKRSAQ